MRHQRRENIIAFPPPSHVKRLTSTRKQVQEEKDIFHGRNLNMMQHPFYHVRFMTPAQMHVRSALARRKTRRALAS